MKKIYTSLFILPLIALVVAFTGGPDAGYTGSPLDGTDCTNCHTPGPASPVTDWFTSDIPPEGYAPGSTYTITISTIGATTSKMGFQVTSETASTKAGLFVITNSTRTQLTAPHTVTHTAAGTDPVGTPNSWTMDWTAPVEGTGTVTFYAAINASDADGSNSGDQIYVASLEVSESNLGIAELDERISSIYPNPATTLIRLDVPVYSQLDIYDNTGRAVMSYTATNEKAEIDVTGLNQGVYFMTIRHQGQMASRTFVKR
jgi:hypothetical protein